MTLVDLPKEVLGVIGAFAHPLGVFVCLAKETRGACDGACQILARELYPAWALPNDVVNAAATEETASLRDWRIRTAAVGQYRTAVGLDRTPFAPLPPTPPAESYSSWRALIVDDNAQAGMWCLDVDAKAGIAGGAGVGTDYETRITRVARDPTGLEQLVVIMEERGERNLDDTHHTNSWGPRLTISVNDAANSGRIYAPGDDKEPAYCKKVQSAYKYLLRIRRATRYAGCIFRRWRVRVKGLVTFKGASRLGGIKEAR